MTARTQAILVHVEIGGKTCLVGRLWPSRGSATFEYDREWLDNPLKFALEPALSLDQGSHHSRTGQALFGALGDSAPDRWGRTLIRRDEERLARKEGRPARTLLEADYLLAVDDLTRQGALRFSFAVDGPFLAEAGAQRVPPLVELPRLLQASLRLSKDQDTDDDLTLLLKPGSSLGGARPKASVRLVDGSLAIAKFPQGKQDEQDIPAWEAVALGLAAKAGVSVARSELKGIAGRNVLITRRFDRDKEARIPFLSAMSMLEASDGDRRSYVEIADAIRRHGSEPEQDLLELWRRIVFTVLISNIDDHLRNHAFLWDGTRGWRLAPAYDLNPVPAAQAARELSTNITEHDNAASINLALEVRERFGVKRDMATGVIEELAKVVSTWREEAARLKIPKKEIDRMASAFDHGELAKAMAGSSTAISPRAKPRKSGLSSLE